MKPSIKIKRLFKFTPLVISSIYLMVSALWIYYSDRLVEYYIRNPLLITDVQTYKGWLFILITALFLYYLISSSLLKIRKATDAVIKSEERYRTLLENASEGIIIGDSSWNILEVNHVACEMTGYSKDELVHMNAAGLIDRDDLRETPLRIEDLKQGRTVQSGRIIRKKDGTIVYSDISSRMLDNGNIMAIARDVTEKHRFEQKLQQSEEQYKLLFRENPHPMWVYDLETMKFLAVNNCAISSYGYTNDEFMHMTLKDIRPAEDVEQLINNITSRRDKYQQSGPWQHRKKDGTIIYVEIISSGIFFEGRDARLVLAKDITETRATFLALRESEARYRELFEKTPVPILEEDFSVIKAHIDLLKQTGVTDFVEYLRMYPEEIGASIPKVRILNANMAAVELYEADDKDQLLSGLTQLFGIDALQAQRESILAISEGHYKFEIETERKTLKGRKLHVRVRWIVAEEYKQDFSRVLVAIVDLTEKKRAEEEVMLLNTQLEKRVEDRTEKLAEANRELEAFSYSVSHDLRAPLRAIHGLTSIILTDHYESLDDEVLKMMEMVLSNSTKMNALISDLLNFSRLQRHEFIMTRVDNNRLIREILDQMPQEDKSRNVKMDITRLPDCRGDEAMLRQVWINLISNAFKYTGKTEQPVISISGVQRENDILYIVEDNGAGFNMKYSEKLFGVFQRLHSDSEFEGTGVGLALIKRIIRKHGGEIWATGEVNHGATFYFTIPHETQTDK